MNMMLLRTLPISVAGILKKFGSFNRNKVEVFTNVPIKDAMTVHMGIAQNLIFE